MKYTILSEKFEETDKYLKRMCKKLKSIGVRHYYTHSEPYDIEYTLKASHPGEKDEVICLNVVDIEFASDDIYHIRGYRIIAVIDHGDNGNLVFLQGGITLNPNEFAILQGLQPNCQHCHTKRKRKKTVILLHEQSNKLMQVGLSCLDGYLGVDISGKLECLTDLDRMLENIDSISDEEVRRLIYTGDYISPTQLLAHLLHAKDVLYGNQKYINYKDLVYRYVREPMGAPTDDNIKRAIEIQRYVASMETTENAFENNLITLCRSHYIRNKYVRILVWAIAKYDDYTRKLELQRKKEEAAAARRDAWKDSTYYGEVGQKLGEIELTCLRQLYTKETNYGYNNTAYTYVYSLTDGKSEFIWSTSNILQEGCKYKLKGGKVKEHKEFEGVPQTVITRCKIIDSDTDEYYKKLEEQE